MLVLRLLVRLFRTNGMSNSSTWPHCSTVGDNWGVGTELFYECLLVLLLGGRGFGASTWCT